LVLYFLLPAILGLFTWKAAAKDVWGEVFLLLTVVCATAHVYQFVRWHGFLRAAQVAAVSGSLFVIVLVGVLYEWGLPHRGLALNGENLEGVYLAREDLRLAALVGANLRGADLIQTDLTDAKLMRANLTGTNFSSANLTGASLMNANLTDAALIQTDLTNAFLLVADLSNAKLWGANLTGASLAFTNLGGVEFIGADLKGTDLSHANLTGAYLADAQHLEQEQLDDACISKGGTPPTLPEGLKPPQNECVKWVR